MVIVFGIALLILKKFAWKPILHALKEREMSITEALASAERARREMEELKTGNEQIMAEARRAKETILEEARGIKDRILEEARGQAEKEGRKMIDAARLQITNEKEAAIAEMKKQVVELSVLMAEKIVRKELDDQAAQEKLVNTLLNDVKLK